MRYGVPSAFLPRSMISLRASLSFSSMRSRVMAMRLASGIVGRIDFQADDRAALAADLLHDVVELHVDDVFHRAAGAFADADDLVLRLEAAVLVGGAAGDDVLHDGVAVDAAERGADAVELQLHRDVEVVERRGGHVAAVRIEAGGHRRQVALEQLVVVGLLPALADAVVALAELLDGLVHRDVVGGFLHQVELHALAPALGRFFGRLGETSAASGSRIISSSTVKSCGLSNSACGQLDAFIDASQEPGEHFVGELDVAALEHVVQACCWFA